MAERRQPHLYGASFGKNSRELTLTGEAYFDVAGDPNHPMIIRTATVTIKVLGTAFNVRAYPERKDDRHNAGEGESTGFVNHKKQLSYMLSPDEKLIVE